MPLLYIFQFLASLAFSCGVTFQTDRRNEYRQEQINIEDLQYYAPIYVGGQLLNAVLDTGSADLVVLSDQCQRTCGLEGRLYHPERSKTYSHGSLRETLAYGSGKLEGEESSDDVNIGPFSSQRQKFWTVVGAHMPLLYHSNFQVIAGLGPIGETQSTWTSMLDNFHVDKYSVCLQRQPGLPGYVTWNDEAATRAPELFTPVEMANAEFWLAELTDVKLGDTELGCHASSCGAILDSGTSLLSLPGDSFEMLSNSVRQLGPNCKDLTTMPDLNFKLNGREFTLPPDAYLGEVVGELSRDLEGHFTNTGKSCQEALMHVGVTSPLGPVWILGMPFFRTFYTVFVQGAPPTAYIAKADADCHPRANTDLEELHGERRNIARRINVSELRLPPWASPGHRTKRGSLVAVPLNVSVNSSINASVNESNLVLANASK